MIEAENGAHLWADRFDGSLEDVFDLQDHVALGIAGVLEPALEEAEIRRSSHSRATDAATCDLYLRALSDHLSFQKDRVFHALEPLRLAIEREPLFEPALSVAAWCHVQIETYGWARDNVKNRREGLALAHRAIQVADDDPAVIGRAAFVVGRFGDDVQGAIALIDKSLQLNPGYASGRHVSGRLRLFAGESDLAIEHFSRSIRLAPRGQRMETLTGIGTGRVLGRRFDDAVAVLRVSLEQFLHFAQTYRYLAAAYAHLGRLDEARETVERMRAITPLVVPPVLPFRNPAHRDLVLSRSNGANNEIALNASGVDHTPVPAGETRRFGEQLGPAGELWRGRFDVARNIIVVDSGHRDLVFATRNRAQQLRYLVRLYVKELVLKNFAGLPADRLAERMIELSLYAEEELKSAGGGLQCVGSSGRKVLLRSSPIRDRRRQPVCLSASDRATAMASR